MQTIAGDTVIVGAGSAGCALAARLSEDGTRQVILIEAGPDDQRQMPLVWSYFTEPDDSMVDRERYWPRGKAVGGSSTVNGLIAIRGQPQDYDDWVAAGCVGWGWDDVLPYFRRMEDWRAGNAEGGASALHGVGGPLAVSRWWGRHFLCDRFIGAAREVLSVKENLDFNGARQEGVGYYPVNVTGWLFPARATASRAYLQAARLRGNLRVIADAHVCRVTFDGRRATGVVYEQAGVPKAATAQRQVILSAGSIGSPQLLQLSGIGNPEELRRLGIEVVAALPAVGENLQDHLQIGSRFRFRARTLRENTRNVWQRIFMAVEGYALRIGTEYGATNFGIFARTAEGLSRPDIQFHVHPCAGPLRSADRFSTLSISGWQLRPESRGRIALFTADPLMPPAISANYLSSEVDQRFAVTILRLTRRLTQSNALQPYRIEAVHPGAEVHSDADLLDFARATGETTYHPVGTCRMGADVGSVVDPRLRVRGVERLYVADASIMPTVISGNTNLPSVMIGERASDLIMEDERRPGSSGLQ